MVSWDQTAGNSRTVLGSVTNQGVYSNDAFPTVGLELCLKTQFVTQTQSYITVTLFTLNYTL